MQDWFQNLRLNQNEQAIQQTKHSAQDNNSQLNALADRVDTLYLMSLAALELLQTQGISRQQILEKMEEIDLRDGKKDGKLAAPSVCPDCGHKVSSRRQHCFFCGSKLSGTGFR